MTEIKHKEHITSEHFGIPADLADIAENYAQWRVQELMAQLVEAKALIEASRKQKPVAYKGKNYGNLHHHDFGNSIPLFAAPVVAPDVPTEITEVAQVAIENVLREYNYPANPKNAARAGWRACRLHIAAMGGTND